MEKAPSTSHEREQDCGLGGLDLFAEGAPVHRCYVRQSWMRSVCSRYRAKPIPLADSQSQNVGKFQMLYHKTGLTQSGRGLLGITHT
jgi:hypothetical protein